jgi:uncharacterized protein
MSLKERILDDLKAAMKAKETDKTMVLRSVKAKILEKEISERKGGESSLNDEQIIEVLLKAAKQRKESIEQFQEGGREELAEKEANELKIIERYLPAMMREEEIREAAQKEIERLKISSMDEMGKVMGALMGKLEGKAEGSVISKVVKEELSKK